MKILPLFVFLTVASAETCENLAKLAIPMTKIASSQLTGPGELPKMHNLPAFCRVTGSIHPTADSDIRFEVWMPLTGWNGKFQGIGNGGFAGTIGLEGLGNAVAHGYATASTDTGHADAVGANASWALNHPEKIVDFGYRAIHETAVAAKAVVKAFYGEGPKKSYFSACSNGGRQALMEAQRFPADYDGIIAGAPANYWTHLVSASALEMKALLAETASYIPAAKLPAIEAAALAACDANDGVKDGVIENPRQCHFDPAVLLCTGAETNTCLTRHQVAALKTVYGGMRDSKGKLLFPGYSPGGEAEPGGWGAWITGSAPEKALMFAFSTQFYKNMVYNDPGWEVRKFDVDRDVKVADQKMEGTLNATDPDLSAFRKRGGKLILYHGWSDAAIPALNAIDYYESAVAKAGKKSAEDFLRLYMVPGMEHCGGGAGPNLFGQGGVGTGDRWHDIDAALEAWVERGLAPDQIIAKSGKTQRTRPLCPYPQIAKWNGNGSTDEAANFRCVVP